MDVVIKSVYEKESPDDGYRVLVDKLWPRGVRKEGLHYDLWAKDLAPSSELRKWFHRDKESNWDEFRRRYMEELRDSDAMDDFIKDISAKKKVTLLYASKDAAENHAIILADHIRKSLK